MANGVLYPRSKKEVDEIIAGMRRASKEIRRTPESARAFLVKAGFIKKTGGLTRRYGGK